MHKLHIAAIGIAVMLIHTPDAWARREANLQDVPTSVTALTEDVMRQMNTAELKDIAAVTPNLRFGQTLPSGSKIQIRGSLDNPSAYVDGIPLDFSISPIATTSYDLESAEVLRGPQGTLYGKHSRETLINFVKATTVVQEADLANSESALDAVRNAQPMSGFPGAQESGLFTPFDTADGVPDLCSPTHLASLMGASIQLEGAIIDAQVDAFNTELGRDIATFRDESDLASGFEKLRVNATLRYNGFLAQYQDLTEYAQPTLDAECEPYTANTEFQSHWFDGVLANATPTYGSFGSSGAGDIGTRTSTELTARVEGPVWTPRASGMWEITDGLSFTGSYARDRLNGIKTGRCEPYRGEEKDFREYSFSAALGMNYKRGGTLDFSLPLHDVAPDGDGDPSSSDDFQSDYSDALNITKRRLCADPYDYAANDGIDLDLTQELSLKANLWGYQVLAPRPQAEFHNPAVDVRITEQFDFGFRSNLQVGNQLRYDAEPRYVTRTPSTQAIDARPRVRFSTDLNYGSSSPPRVSYTIPNLAPSEAFMSECFEPIHYGNFSIGPNKYIRVFITPALAANLMMRDLEIVGVFIDPLRGPQSDPHMAPTPAGGGGWGQPHDDQWAIKKAGFTAGPISAWSRLDGQAQEDVVVAVIDTGLDWHHQDIAAENIWRNVGEVPGNNIDDDNNGYVDDVMGYDFMERDNKPWDEHGHGTMVSGIIAATRDNEIGIAGINSKAQIMTLRVTNTFGNTNASYIAEAIAYAADNGANVINISMGGAGRSALEQEAIAYAREKGVLVVVAAGNEGIELDDYGPSAEDGVFTVAATDLNDRPADFSNTGAVVDIAAPGIDVLSLRARGTDVNLGAAGIAYTQGQHYVGADKRYIRASGTSFAAPIVTGTASALMAVEPELSADEVRERLAATAWDVGAPGKDDQTGAGLIDARTALSVDKSFFLDASVDRLVPNADAQTLEIHGRADADHFKRAWLQIGEGEAPESWKYVGLKLKRPVKDALLSEVPLSEFGGATGVWTVRINVEHQSGTVRRATKAVRLR